MNLLLIVLSALYIGGLGIYSFFLMMNHPHKNNGKAKGSEKALKMQTLNIVFEKQKIEVGKTTVKLTFDDLTNFETFVIGKASQNFRLGNDEVKRSNPLSDEPMREPTIEKIFITDSQKLAEDFIQHRLGFGHTFVNDPTCPNKSYYGTAIKAEIGNTCSYKIDCDVATLVEKINEQH